MLACMCCTVVFVSWDLAAPLQSPLCSAAVEQSVTMFTPTRQWNLSTMNLACSLRLVPFAAVISMSERG